MPYDVVRSHIPLRGSSGLAPDSLLRRSTFETDRTSCTSKCRPAGGDLVTATRPLTPPRIGPPRGTRSRRYNRRVTADLDDSTPSRPWQLSTAIVLVIAQAVGLLALAGYMALQTVAGATDFLAAAIGEIVVVVAVAFLLLFLANKLRHFDASGRGLTVFMGLLWLPVGWFLHQANHTDWTIGVWTLAVLQTVLLVVEPTRIALGVDNRFPMTDDNDSEPSSDEPKG